METYKKEFKSKVFELVGNNEFIGEYLMTSFHFNKFNFQYQYKNNLPAILKAYESFLSFDVSEIDNLFERRIVVVGSTQSKYILEDDIKGYETKFGSFLRERDLLMLDCSHSVQFDKFEETLNHLLKLYND